ncbi:MAG: MGMT family protein [Mucilaginibacter polytrichastri]|nr:MGMT family protein [Mucilaginibacter polytrichastri]
MKDDNFFEKVYEVVRLVPPGRVTSYGAIAKFLGTGGSARMVGYAMFDAGKVHPPVPAHRVLNRNGDLTGKAYFGGNRMQQMLESEHMRVENDRVVDFKTLFWDPEKELL